MPLHPLSEHLKTELEGLQLLHDRYEHLQLVNAPAGEPRRGCLSLVFKAWDRVESKDVALKFYDVDPRLAALQYRVDCFKREHAILQQLIGVDRCLQLTSPLTTYTMILPLPGGGTYPMDCQYFAVDWLDAQIDHYFLNQQAHDAVHRLILFIDILLAVEALHGRGIFHRDLKADNLRAHDVRASARQAVVAIDLGTAAKIESPQINTSYPSNVGAPGYAAPEAQAGLAGVREVAKYTDFYALGCLLFELFHADHFFDAYERANLDLYLKLGALQSSQLGCTSDEQRLTAWHTAIVKFSPGIQTPSLDSPGSSCPVGISQQLDNVVAGLTALDYRRRIELRRARELVSSAIKALSNEREYARRVKAKRDRRQARLQKLQPHKASPDLLHEAHLS